MTLLPCILEEGTQFHFRDKCLTHPSSLPAGNQAALGSSGWKLRELLAHPYPCVSLGSAEDYRSWLFVISLGWQWLAAPTHKQQALSMQTPAGPSPCTTPSARGQEELASLQPEASCVHLLLVCWGKREGCPGGRAPCFPRKGAKKGSLPNFLSTPIGLQSHLLITRLSPSFFICMTDRDHNRNLCY